MSILNLKNRTAVALGQKDSADAINPLEVLGLSWRITLMGLEEEKLYDFVKSFAQKMVSKIHPDVVKRDLNDEELKIMDAFERLKKREVFLEHLSEFRARRSEESYQTRAVRENSARVARSAKKMELEKGEETEKRWSAEQRATFAEKRLLGFLKAQGYLSQERDDQVEILSGKSTQRSIYGVNGIRQIVVCDIDVSLVPAPSKIAASSIDNIRKKLETLSDQYDKLDSQLRGTKDEKQLARIKRKLSPVITQIREVWENVITQRLGCPTLAELISESIPELSEEGAPLVPGLPIVEFSIGDIPGRLSFKKSNLVRLPKPENQQAKIRREAKYKRLLNSSETPQNLSEVYLYALQFYVLTAPKDMVVKRIRISPRVVPVRNGTLAGFGPGIKSRARIVGCLPLPTFNNLSAEMISDGSFYVSEETVLRNMMPCVTQGSMLVTVAVDSRVSELHRLAKGDADTFYAAAAETRSLKFLSQFVVLAIY